MVTLYLSADGGGCQRLTRGPQSFRRNSVTVNLSHSADKLLSDGEQKSHSLVLILDGYFDESDCTTQNDNMKLPKCSRYALVLCLFTGWVGSALAETTDLYPVADMAIRDSLPDNNYGGVTNLPVGVSNLGSPRNRGLFKFGFEAIPTNATITAVTLRLIVTQSLRPPADFECARSSPRRVESR